MLTYGRIKDGFFHELKLRGFLTERVLPELSDAYSYSLIEQIQNEISIQTAGEIPFAPPAEQINYTTQCRLTQPVAAVLQLGMLAHILPEYLPLYERKLQLIKMMLSSTSEYFGEIILSDEL